MRKYMHIERFGNTEVDGINEGLCYIFSKIDGTNGSIWLENNELKCASRNRDLSEYQDNAGFYKYVMENKEKYLAFFNEFPTVILYGEWLVPHTLKTYRDNTWYKFYVFDVYNIEKDEFINYEEYNLWCIEYYIDFIPALCKVNNPSLDTLHKVLDKNIFLIKDGCGYGEGICIKRYDFINKYKRVVWAKLVRNEFKDSMIKNETPKLFGKDLIEEKIIDMFVTESLIDKTYAKIVNENDGWSSKNVPQLFSTVYYDLIKEEMWEILKKFKNPVIDFKLLNRLVVLKIKEIKKELF